MMERKSSGDWGCMWLIGGVAVGTEAPSRRWYTCRVASMNCREY